MDIPNQDIVVMNINEIPVIDLFAGPGGLGEGFASFSHKSNMDSPFKICASVEMDKFAHQTLELRSFVHEFNRNEIPDEYYMHLRQEITKEDLYAKFPIQASAAKKRAILGTLGDPIDDPRIYRSIEDSLKNNKGKPWVLIGGPPCQAYSLIGRSRRQAKGIGQDKQAKDKRNFLYLEYLNIIAKFEPSVFVMENVKGILSAEVDGVKMFPKILNDLRQPSRTLKNSTSKIVGKEDLSYVIHSLVVPTEDGAELSPNDYLIKSEKYGVPQARHRVILLGIRSDIKVQPKVLIPHPEKITVREMIDDLPKLRSSFSRTTDIQKEWYDFISEIKKLGWYKGYKPAVPTETTLNADLVKKKMSGALKNMRQGLTTGDAFIKQEANTIYRPDWFNDRKLGGVINHSSRPHMKADLHRYFFAATYTDAYGISPRIKNFPLELLPKHKNVVHSLAKGAFSDRFKVQDPNRPASTITCHISKDGHYNIHYDPTQCRSLTVREAARLQTFPDNYFFTGPRTQQYHQVGNAVPPLLAVQIADIVHDVISNHNGVTKSYYEGKTRLSKNKVNELLSQAR